jgi:hypothetical protein
VAAFEEALLDFFVDFFRCVVFLVLVPPALVAVLLFVDDLVVVAPPPEEDGAGAGAGAVAIVNFNMINELLKKWKLISYQMLVRTSYCVGSAFINHWTSPTVYTETLCRRDWSMNVQFYGDQYSRRRSSQKLKNGEGMSFLPCYTDVSTHATIHSRDDTFSTRSGIFECSNPKNRT